MSKVMRFSAVMGPVRWRLAMVWLAAVPAACTVNLASAEGMQPRGYEVVSPSDKNGSNVEMDYITRGAASGDAVTYSSYGNFAGGGGGGAFHNQFLSSRGSGGWATRGINAPQDPPPTLGPGQQYEAFSGDLSKGVTISWRSRGFADAPPMMNLFLYDAATDGFELLSRPFEPIAPDPQFVVGTNFAGATSDYSHIVFGSHRALTADAPPDTAGIGDGYLYEWFDHQLHLVSILPGEDPLVGTVALGSGLPGPPVNFEYPGDRPVSEDGSRVFFTTPYPANVPQELYLREGIGGASPTTVHVSVSERTDCADDPHCGGDDSPDLAPDPAGPASATFLAANASGSVAYFRSREKLTDDAKAHGVDPADRCADADGGDCFDLYRWDESAPADARLSDLTSADPAGGGVLGLVGSSDDASRLYFVAMGALEGDAVRGNLNLYLWQEGAGVRFIGALDGSPHPIDSSGGNVADQGMWSAALATGSGPRYRDARVTADGQRLVFRSRARLTAFDNAGHYQIYLYDAVADTLSCISCNVRAGVDLGDAFLKRRTPRTVVPPWSPRNMSEDGQRVVFDSAEALVPDDTDGKIDVYEWEGGQVRLISGGGSDQDSAFIDASATGGDVFFSTREQLACQDTDQLVDVYDARVGGGFGPCTPPADCRDEGCQGPFAAIPVAPVPGSSTYRGAGNPKTVKAKPKSKLRCRKGFVRRKAKGRKARCVKVKSKLRRAAVHGTRRPNRRAR